MCNSACADGAVGQHQTIRQSAMPAWLRHRLGRRVPSFTMPMCVTSGRIGSITRLSGNNHGWRILRASAGCARTAPRRPGRVCAPRRISSQQPMSTTSFRSPSAGSGGSTGAIFAASVTSTTRQNARKRGRGVPEKVPDPALQHRAGRSARKKVPNHGIAGTGRAWGRDAGCVKSCRARRACLVCHNARGHATRGRREKNCRTFCAAAKAADGPCASRRTDMGAQMPRVLTWLHRGA